MKTINTNIVIIGAGIAGLWLHHRLNNMGYHAILIEKGQLGQGQTLSSQGIIHGGAKYTLNGALSNAASSIADMPKRWLDCLAGQGEIDLSSTSVLSPHQLMWSTSGISSKLTSFLSSKALNGKMEPLSKDNHPVFFQQKSFNGNLYQLNEPVLDTSSLVDTISRKWRHRILQLKDHYSFTESENGISELNINDSLSIKAQQFIFTSGEGNEELLKKVTHINTTMQRRPLQMLLAKGPQLPKLYAHCIGASTKPIATITTHQHSDGEWVWYIGGNVAEDGVGVNSETLINNTQKTLKKILPWVDLTDLQWTTHTVNRAEPAQKNLLRPDTAFLESKGNIHIAWPTKLALAPNLSDKYVELLNRIKIETLNQEQQQNTDKDIAELSIEYSPSLCPSLWDRSFNEAT